MPAQRRRYVQFSKKVVIAVCTAVTLICVSGIVLDYLMGDAEQATQVIKVYIQYAMVVFAAYSGNSAVEKWLTHRYNPSFSDPVEKETQESQNG